VNNDEQLAARLEGIAEWHVGLRPSEQADLRSAAERLRSISRPPPMTPPMAARPSSIPDAVPAELGS
jgi:hypothetical protein